MTNRQRGSKPTRGRQRTKDGDPAPRYIYGLHTVEAALGNPARHCRKLFLSPNAAARFDAILAGMPCRPPQVETVSTADLNKLCGPDAVHQGVVLDADPLSAPALEDIAASSARLLILDQVQDPHNVGAILRSAAAFNVGAMIMTERHSVMLNAVLAKAASGALEFVPIIKVVNLARTLDDIAAWGFQRIGLDSDASISLETVDTAGPIALVLGAEGKGLRRLTRENCDHIARLNMPGKIKSLNVSNAAAIALYTLNRP